MSTKPSTLQLALLAAVFLSACLATRPRTHVGSGEGLPNVQFPTLGGKQVWADTHWRDGWRVQRNVLLGYSRLLDPNDVRRAWGSELQCENALARQVPKTPAIDHLVVILHGLGRSPQSMSALEADLNARGMRTASLAYPSTRGSLSEHADRLNQLIEGLDHVERISFVTHSMGGLVVRLALSEDAAWRSRIELGRVVQIAPPNQGSELAAHFTDSVIEDIGGPCLEVVGRDDARDLPRLPCEFAIVAGGKGDGEGWNPWIKGDDDGVVAVSETQLAGASEVLVVREVHTFLMHHPRTLELVARFLGKLDEL